MRMVPAILLAAALTACDRRRAAVAMPPTPAKPTAGPADAAQLAQWREDSLRGCIGGARDRVRDPDVPVERHCACAVDREMAGKSLAALEEEERSGAHETIFRRCCANASPRNLARHPLQRLSRAQRRGPLICLVGPTGA